MVHNEDAYQMTLRQSYTKMEITITTPALLFPAISLLMISYTTRFLHLAHLARSLHAINPGAPEPTVLEQIKNIRKRILLIRNMQATGISSLLLCVICMFSLFGGQAHIAQSFIASLALMHEGTFFTRWSWSALDIWSFRTAIKKNKNACTIRSFYHNEIDPTLFPFVRV